MTANQDWGEMIKEFRALGGVLENVRMGRGAVGRGLFPIDPSKPARVLVPDNLLLPVEDMEFVNGRLQMKPKGETPTREEKFFAEYQEAYSWGAGGRTDCEAFFESMAALPEPVREVLTKDWGLGYMFKGADAKAVQNRFLRTRMINRNARGVLMPVLELVNHGVAGTPFNFAGGISVSGNYTNEVLARYNFLDPLGVFLAWGFPSAEPVSHSLGLKLPLGSSTLVIGREVTKNKVHERIRIPEVTQEDGKIVFSHLMLGHKRFPKLSRGVFQLLMKEHAGGEIDELFDRIRQINGVRFLNLLAVLDEHEGRTVATLRQMCHYQIMSMMFCVGTREL